MASNDWPTETASVVSLWLDEQNVRIDLGSKTPSQDALIEDLFINQGALDLAKSIASEGLFPNDLPIIVEEGGKQVVLEGNRRLAALKALLNPDAIPKYKAQLQKLAESSPVPPIENITVVRAPDRASADRVIARIHTTKSRKPWAPLRQAYFYYAQVESGKKTVDQLLADYAEVDVRRFVGMWEMHRIATSADYSDEDLARKVRQQSRFPISTLERIYKNTRFQQAFSLNFKDNGQVEIKSDPQAFLNAYKSVIADVVNKVVTSRTLNTASDIDAKIDSWAAPLAGKNANQEAIKASDFAPTEAPKPLKKAKGLAPKDINCSLPFPAIGRMLVELQTINYERFPNATHDLMRSFLECALKAFFQHADVSLTSTKGGAGGYTSLNDVLLEAEKHFKKTKKGLVQAVKTIQGGKDYLHSQDFLNSVNHNHNTFSTGKVVKEAWDQMEPILRFILNPR